MSVTADPKLETEEPQPEPEPEPEPEAEEPMTEPPPGDTEEA